jgi:hypothetical protein
MGCAFLPVVLARLLGETVSLSTLDVRAAFAFVYQPWGLPIAVMIVILRHALPTLGFVLGFALALAHVTSASLARVVVSLAAAMTAQAFLAAGVLAVRGTDPIFGALALGAYLRLASELSYAFCSMALVIWISVRTAHRSTPPALP